MPVVSMSQQPALQATRRVLAVTDIQRASPSSDAAAASNGVSILPVPDPIQALDLLRSGGYDAVSVTFPVPGWTAEEFLEEVQRVDRKVPVIFQGDATVHEAVRLIKLGAHHFMPAGAGPAEIEALLAPPERGLPEEPWRKILVGGSAAMRNVADTIRLVGPRRCTVLVTGETGTGKDLAARAIHAASNRAHLPLVAVNCGAIPETLLEAELFGHVKGAFTGAISNRTGRFEQAHQGTIFLDEIAEMPLDLQSKLLRVLQEREFQRLGRSDTIRVDVRVIAACNVDLSDRVRQGKFREDLFYRLNVVPLPMPPLRERPSDIPLLVEHFVEKVCTQERIPRKHIARETLDRLCRYFWPGNVRQLENAIEMAVTLSGDRDVLYPGDFPLPSRIPEKTTPSAVPSHIAVPDEGLDFERVVNTIERGILEQALRKSNGNKKAAADLLRLKRTTLAAKLKALQAAGAGV